MKLKINSMYELADGRKLIPRSHWSESDAPNFAVFEVLAGGGERFTKTTTTYTRAELKKVLGLAKNERVELI